MGYLGLLLREAICSGLDALQYFTLIGDLVLILVHVAPQGDVRLALHGHLLMEDPPALAIEDLIRQVRIICQQVT